MRSPPVLAVAVALGIVLALIALPAEGQSPPAPSRADEPPEAETPIARPPPPRQRGSTFDPVLALGLTFLPTSAVMVGIGASELEPDADAEVCGPTGACIEPISRAGWAWAPGFIAAGASYGVFGLVSTVVGGTRTASERPTGPLASTGTWLLGTGVSTTLLGALTLSQRIEHRNPVIAITAMGGLEAVGGLGLLIAGASKSDPDYAPSSAWKVGLGVPLATAGVAAAPATILLCDALGRDGDSSRYGVLATTVGIAFLCIPAVTANVAAVAGGLAFWASGAKKPPETVVSLRLGLGGARLRGTW